MDYLSRSIRMIGQKNIEKINRSSVLIFGLGGVGGAAVETLVRTGIGKLGIVDCDIVEESNLNRQIIATKDTIGMRKTKACRQRIESIRSMDVVEYDFNYNKDTVDQIDFKDYDYIVDAIDTVSSKLLIIQRAVSEGKKVLSVMGTGNKLNPLSFEIVPIEKTKYCPLARVMRRELKKRKIYKVPVLYSKEIPQKVGDHIPGSMSFVPPVAGMIVTSYIVNDIIKS
ncbi:MAG: ThiF family adenylyltransferase [Tissierellia bacterium]|nr:ThiF family adenylyltransferase [Tissierellia bacterium]